MIYLKKFISFVCLMRFVVTGDVESDILVYVYNIKAYALSQENYFRGLTIKLNHV